MYESYDKKSLIRYVAIFAIIILMMKFTSGIGFAVMIPLVLIALSTGRNEDLLFYLMVTGTVVVGNTFFFPKSSTFFLIQRGIIAVLSVLLGSKIFGRRLPIALKPLWGLVAYVIYMVVPSSLGWSPMVSYLKMFLFLLCLFAYIGVVTHILTTRRIRQDKLRSILLAFGIVYILGSTLLIPFPAISQLTGEDYANAVAAGRHVTSLFTGMTNQSQCLGPVISILSCFLLGDLLFAVRRWDKLYVLLLSCCPILIYKTSSRTAMGTYLIGTVIVLFFFMKARGITSKWRSKALGAITSLGVLALLVASMSSGVRQGALNFMLKWGDETKASDISVEALASTRQGLVDSALKNFKKSPLYGNGFQVSENMSRYKARSIKDVLSAPIEKGVWVTAVLEEGGVAGFVIFLLFLLTCWIMLTRCHAYLGCSLLMTFLVSNFGEFSFFSMSYIGGFMWAMVFMGLTFDCVRNRDRDFETQMGFFSLHTLPPPSPNFPKREGT